MPDLAFDNVFEARDYTGERFKLSDHRQFARTTRDRITLDAGETKLVYLDRQTGVAKGRIFLALDSSVEGVWWWPIDSATPSIDAGTRAFGWLFETNAVYEHNHGTTWDPSPGYVNHAGGVGEDQYHGDSLPVWQSLTPAPPAANAGFHRIVEFEDASATGQPRVVGMNGQALKSEYIQNVQGGVPGQYLIGMDNYYNLGTPYDGLGIYSVTYSDDSAPPYTVSFNLYNWPFDSGISSVADLPALTPQGRVHWANNDLQLCQWTRSPVATTPPICGWSAASAGVNFGGAFTFAAGQGALQITSDGWWVGRNEKESAVPGFYTAHPDQAYGGNSRFDRITAIQWNITWRNPSRIAYLANAWFGPLAGRNHILRPYCYFDDHGAWATASQVAIGLQNPTTRRATVDVAFGIDP